MFRITFTTNALTHLTFQYLRSLFGTLGGGAVRVWEMYAIFFSMLLRLWCSGGIGSAMEQVEENVWVSSTAFCFSGWLWYYLRCIGFSDLNYISVRGTLFMPCGSPCQSASLGSGPSSRTPCPRDLRGPSEPPTRPSPEPSVPF